MKILPGNLKIVSSAIKFETKKKHSDWNKLIKKETFTYGHGHISSKSLHTKMIGFKKCQHNNSINFLTVTHSKQLLLE